VTTSDDSICRNIDILFSISIYRIVSYSRNRYRVGATENAGVENAGVAAMERQSNTKGCCTARRQSNVFF